MIVTTTFLFLLAYMVSGKKDAINDNDELDWPANYNVEVTKLYLTSGWVEHLKYWKSKSLSRVDFNNGAVTKISNPQFGSYGVQYEIHPETTEEKANEKVCYNISGTRESIINELELLPDLPGFEKIDLDVIRGIHCWKATRKMTNDEKHLAKEESIWLFKPKTSKKFLVPVRYESRMSDIRHGYLKNHMIYDYFNFHPIVNKKVFKVYENYECIERKNNHDDEITLNTDMKSMKVEEKKELDKAFDVYKQRFNKKYNHQAEHEMRKSIFHQKWRLVTETNQGNLSYKLALNKMSDRTNEELKRYKGLRREKVRTVGNVRFPYSEEEIKKISEALPSEYDLRLEGVVGPVLRQEDCGSCWTFGTTAAVEGALARSNGGTLITLSNQALLDCSWGMGNHGCNGGSDIKAYKWIMKHGLPTVEEYGPYINENGYCNIENMNTTYKIRGWTDVTPLSEEALKIAIIKHGPLSVSVHATDAFEEYDGGIFYDTTCKPGDLDHEVTLVGYGKKDGESFWIIRNSWGRYWGLDGYMHISTRNNNCGIMTEPTYVVMK